MIAAAWLAVAAAAPIGVRACATWTTDIKEDGYEDDDDIDLNGDGITTNDHSDVLFEDAAYRMHGMLLLAEKVDNAGNFIEVLYFGYAVAGGPNGGCTPVLQVEPLPTGLLGLTAARIRLTATSAVKSGPHTLRVRDDDVNDSLGVVEGPIVTFLSSGTQTAHLGSNDKRFDTALIMALALHREDGDAAPIDLDVYTCENPGGATNCLDPDASGGVYQHDDQVIYEGSHRVSTMLHELGHAVVAAQMPNQSEPWVMTYDWSNLESTPPDSACMVAGVDGWMPPLPYLPESPAHHRESDEATSAAIVEGYAWYYAAIILNDTTEGDCFVSVSNRDWDHNGAIDIYEDTTDWMSCEGIPVANMPASMGRDYWEDQCEQADVYSVASEYDWMRGLWDLDTDEGLTFTDLVDVFAFANPDTWIEDAVVSPIPWGGLSLGDYPWFRMYVSADNIGVGVEWDNQCDNGICR
jgi:hypothetical protein